MKQLILCTLYILFCSTTSYLFAQDNKEEQTAAMQKWMEYMTPSSVHKIMARSVGEWTTSMQMWEGPNVKPSKSEGTCKSEMILGGRYLQSKYSSTVMGMPFEGISTDGYDNGKKVYFNTWVDNMGTGTTLGVPVIGNHKRVSNFSSACRAVTAPGRAQRAKAGHPRQTPALRHVSSSGVALPREPSRAPSTSSAPSRP